MDTTPMGQSPPPSPPRPPDDGGSSRRETGATLRRVLAAVATLVVAAIVPVSLIVFGARVPMAWATQLVKALEIGNGSRDVLALLGNLGVGGAGALVVSVLWSEIGKIGTPLWTYLKQGGSYFENVLKPSAVVFAVVLGVTAGALGANNEVARREERTRENQAKVYAKTLRKIAVREGGTGCSDEALVKALGKTLTVRFDSEKALNVKTSIDLDGSGDEIKELASEVHELTRKLGDLPIGTSVDLRNVQQRLKSIDGRLEHITTHVSFLAPHGVWQGQ